MARIAGVDLPRNKRIEIALTYIYGIGRTRAQRDLREGDVRPTRAPTSSPTARSCASARSSSATTRSRATCAARRRRTSSC